MFKHSVTTAALCGAVALTSAHQATAEVTSEAQVVLTITINDIFLLNPDDTGSSAIDGFEVILADIGTNTNLFTGGSPSNDPDAVGTATASETVFFNGIDINGDFIPSEVELDQGDTIVITQNVSATSFTLDTTYFGQVMSDVSLSFDSFGNDDQRYFFDFDVQATMTGEFDLSMPGSALALAEGEEIYALADSTVPGDPVEFILFGTEEEDFYNFFESTTAETVTPFSETGTTLNIPVEFGPGEFQNTIAFRSSLLVNASTVPEPSTGLLLAGLGLAAAARRRRR